MAEEEAMDTIKQLFGFLQGEVPEGYEIKDSHVPHLSPDQAWTVVWYMQELHYQLSDAIERCDVCGELFDTDSEGAYLDYGDAPYLFCPNCQNTEEFSAKQKQEPTDA